MLMTDDTQDTYFLAYISNSFWNRFQFVYDIIAYCMIYNTDWYCEIMQ